MAWTTPKTNWVNGDYFNIDPDYKRIKGNIEYLIALSKEMYPDYAHPMLDNVTIDGYPVVSFFNNVVNATQALLTNCYSPNGSKSMRVYTANGVGWNSTELNNIESNHLLLYNALTGQKECLPRLQITLGGVKIGS